MGKILVIEDNAVSRILAALLLERAGHTVLQAIDAESGMPVARAQKPDLILMDLQLPGMTGLEAARLLKRDPATYAIPVLAFSAMAASDDERRIMAAGFDGYVAKPLRPDKLWSTIGRYLATGAGYGALHANHAEC
jgi:CheY-like chemotaxis protein